LLRSRNGLALTAIRDSEPASESLGVRVRNMKWFVYVCSAAGCGMAGALIFITKLRISPEAAFSIDWTAIMFFVVVIGGIGTIEGPILGAVAYFVLRETLDGFGTWYLIILGLVAIVLMLRMPKGIWGYVANRFDIRFFPVQRRLVLRQPGDRRGETGS
jgi:branched-chain amino acid transport system permease protein